MRKTVATIADIIEEGISSSDVEEICRGAVVDEIEERARLIVDDEIEQLIAPIVSEEVVVNPEERIDGGEVELTDVELANLPDESRAVDEDGEDLVIVSGRAYRARVVPDRTAKSIAEKLSNEMRHAHAMLVAMGDADEPFDELWAEDFPEYPQCPDCGCIMVTPVWVEDGMQTLLCSDCGEEFEVPVEDAVDRPEIADFTSESVDIVPGEISGIICFDGGEWEYEVWVDGECVQSGTASTPEEAYVLFSEIGEVYASICEGTELRMAGRVSKVSAVEGGTISVGNGTASRAKMACLVVAGRAIASNPDDYTDEVEDGDLWVNEAGSSMKVTDVDGDDVYFEDTDAGERSAGYVVSPMVMGRQAFLKRAAEGGYRLV